MLKIAHLSKTEKINVPKRFFITNIYALGDHNILTHFLVVTKLLLGSRTLVTGKNGTGCDFFSQQIMFALG